jgi:putative methyltransferase (TIGR04325 family)
MSGTTTGAQPAREPLWQGEHRAFADVPCAGNAYDGEAWTRAIAARIERWRAAVRAAEPLAPVPERPTHLAAVIAGMGAPRCSVLDVGGGGATALLHARASLPAADLAWTVVERPAVCAAARALVREPGLEFVAEIPGRVHDIAYFGSSLQYFEDWREALRSAARAAARFVLLEDVPVVRCPSFAAAQRYYGGAIPAWFIGHDDLAAAVAACGLRVVLRERFRAPILGQWEGFPMDNYPESRRVGLSSSFLLARGA